MAGRVSSQDNASGPVRLVPRHVLNRFVAVLDAQFWLLGRDVEHPEGNILCRLGFVADVHSPGDLPRVARRDAPCPPPVLRAACCWFAGYERAVESIFGVGHRVPRPGCTPSLAPSRPCALDHAWTELSVLALGESAPRG